MLTQNKVGITPRQENIPLTIEHNYVVGFDYTRNWQLRVVKDFGSWASFGLSIENPAELVYAGTGAVANGGNVGGWLVNFSNAGNTFLNGAGVANNFAPDVAPDIIGKAAFDPGWGHYEVFGIARFFNDNTFGCVVATTTAGGSDAWLMFKHCRHPGPRPAKPEDQERRWRRRFGAVALHQIRRLHGLDDVRQRHRPLWRRDNCPMSSSRPMGPCRPSKRSTH